MGVFSIAVASHAHGKLRDLTLGFLLYLLCAWGN